MAEVDPVALELLAIDIARAAGAELLEHFGNATIDLGTKSSHTDMVTAADLASEALIISRITAERPNDSIVSEEAGATQGSSNVEWVIDPLDGTTNFLYGRPVFSVAIGVRFNHKLIVGVVYSPCTGELFHAHLGGGAWLNGEAIGVRHCPTVDHALIALDFSYKPALRRLQGDTLARLIPRIRDVRRLGSPTLDLCHLAAGQIDGLYDFIAWPWDFAAGALIAIEAGAIITDFVGQPTFGSEGVQDMDVLRGGAIATGIVGASPAIFSEFRAAVVDSIDADQLQAVSAELFNQVPS